MNRGTCAIGRRGTWETSSSPVAELRRYRQAKATKRGGMGDEESERADGAVKRGNRPEGTLRSKGRAGTRQP
jgi:predicted NBD/HSP70 family sugar kinase